VCGLDDLRLCFHIVDFSLDRTQAICTDPVAFIEQNDVGIEQLIACRFAGE